jgi:antitoxin (DNA-binding transcriptional repressor) of toxin-antitoxin stability system
MVVKAMTVGQIKAEFSDVLADVRKGQTVAVEFGRKRKRVAMIVPYQEATEARKLGVLRETASFLWMGDGKISDDDLLNA